MFSSAPPEFLWGKSFFQFHSYSYVYVVCNPNWPSFPSVVQVTFCSNCFRHTVPTHINLRRFIKIWGFQGGGLLKILPIKASKSLKKWTFGPKKWRFIQILLYWWFNQEWRFICVDMVCQYVCVYFCKYWQFKGKISLVFTKICMSDFQD